MCAIHSPPPRVPPVSLKASRNTVMATARGVLSNSMTAWEPIPSASPQITMSSLFTPPKNGERPIALGKAVAKIDCSALSALAWFHSVLGRERMKRSVEDSSVFFREISVVRSQHDQTHVLAVKLPFPLYRREFVSRMVCATDPNGDLLLAAMPVHDDVDYGTNHVLRVVRAAGELYARFSKRGANQCEVTLYVRGDAGGNIPAVVMLNKMRSVLELAEHLRSAFERDEQIDRGERDELAGVIDHETQTYSADETAHMRRSRVKLGRIGDNMFDSEDSEDSYVTCGTYSGEDGQQLGRASAVVDAAGSEVAAFYCLLLKSRLEGGSEECVENVVNAHHSVVKVVRDFKVLGLHPREFEFTRIWRKEEGGGILVCDEGIGGLVRYEGLISHKGLVSYESAPCRGGDGGVLGGCSNCSEPK